MGGHVFQGSQPIRKERINSTVKKFGEEIGKIFTNEALGIHFQNADLLGSAGKKPVSGDIDLAINKEILTIMSWVYDEHEYRILIDKYQKRARTATYNQLRRRALITKISEYINFHSDLIKTTDKGAGNGTLFCQFPQFDENGEDLGYEVQIDINFGNVEWLKFAYQSAVYVDENIKGLHRTQLMIALFTNKGYVFSHNFGVKNKETQEIVAGDPKNAITLLNKEYGINLTYDILSNYIQLHEYLMSHLPLQELHKIYDLYLKVLDSTRCDIPMDLQNYWIENKDRLKLSGKYLPSTSNLTKYLN